MMTTERAVQILTPGATRYTPEEYEQALEVARDALRWRSFDKELPCEGDEFLCTDGRYLWVDEISCGEQLDDGSYAWSLDSGNDINGRLWWKPKPQLPKEAET